MKFALALFLGIASTEQLFLKEVTDAPESMFKSVKNRFGNIETNIIADFNTAVFQKDINLGGANNHYYFDYEQQANHLDSITKIMKGEHEFKQPGDVESTKCHTHNQQSTSKTDEFMFAPAFTGQISEKNNKITFDGNCFEETTFEFVYDDARPSEVKVIATMEKPRTSTCSDFYLFGNTEIQHAENFFFHGKHTLTFKAPTEDAIIDLKAFGLETYLFCEDLQDELLSVFTSLKAFIGGLGMHGKTALFDPKVPAYMEAANIRFMKWALNIELEERSVQKVEIPEENIQSGDYLAVMRLDGLDPMIMFGTGSRSGHSVMAMRFDGELYIVESQDAWYWPTHRIQRTPFKAWLRFAENCDFHVVHMPLNKEMRTKFDQKKAEDFFFQTEGLPYGYHNFLYSWVDTPEQNWPVILPKDLVPVVFSLIEKYDKNLTDNFFTEALNFHLGTKGLNISGIAAEGSKQGLNVTDVMAMPEKDGWEYTGSYHDGLSYVCSTYVAAMWKAAGLFDDMEINAAEWSPKDVYQVDFFDKDYKRPQACVDADPDGGFCQLLGKYRMEFPGWSSIKAYAHQNDHCPSVAPDFVRPDGC